MAVWNTGAAKIIYEFTTFAWTSLWKTLVPPIFGPTFVTAVGVFFVFPVVFFTCSTKVSIVSSQRYFRLIFGVIMMPKRRNCTRKIFFLRWEVLLPSLSVLTVAYAFLSSRIPSACLLLVISSSVLSTVTTATSSAKPMKVIACAILIFRNWSYSTFKIVGPSTKPCCLSW